MATNNAVNTTFVGQTGTGQFVGDTDPAITGGSLDGSIIGATTAADANFTTVDVVHTAPNTDDHALEIDCDAAGFGDVKALDIAYVTGALAANSEEGIILVNIDDTASLGGEVFGAEVITTPGIATVFGMRLGALVHPIEQLSGTFGNADTILNKAADVTAALAASGGGGVTFFVDNADTFTVGDAANFFEISFELTTGASGAGVKPTFEFSDGIGSWVSFTPTDGTNGFRNTGVIVWDIADVPGWVTGASTKFLIRITRTQVTVNTDPVAFELQIASIVEYHWHKNGALHVLGLDDANNNELLRFTEVASAVNYLTLGNNSTGANPGWTATGSDSDVGQDFLNKGLGVTNFLGNATKEAIVRLFEDTSNGVNYVGLKSPALLSGSQDYTLPAAVAAGNDYALVGSTGGVLSFKILPIAGGGTGVASVTIAPGVTAWAGWDANSNLSADNFLAGYTTTATAAGTTTLLVGSTYSQFFTGSTTQIMKLPVVSTLVLGQQFYVVNNSSGAVTVNSSGDNEVQVMAGSSVALITCILITGTSAASWSVEYVTAAAGAGAFLPLAGGTMSGAIAMGTSKITGMGDPTLAQDAATKQYVDNNAGGTITNLLLMGG